MKVSKKEKFLLGILLTILISVVYYQFIYTSQVENLNTKKQELVEIENKYNETMQVISNLENKKSQIKVINSNISEKSAMFYPTLLQEKIILEIDTLITASGLKANISFSPIEVAIIETLSAPEVKKQDSSLQAIADDYNNKDGQTVVANNKDRKQCYIKQW